MAYVKLLAPKILKLEGGFVNDPIDPGGATNKGITLSTWKQVGYDKDGDGDVDVDDIRLLSVEDFTVVLKKNYWDKWRADEIKNQSIADILVDWVWGSGKWGIIIPQRILCVKDDGVVGDKTLAALNAELPSTLFRLIFDARERFLNSIIEDSIAKYENKIDRKSTPDEQLKFTLKRFEKGWLNRLNDFKFEA